MKKRYLILLIVLVSILVVGCKKENNKEMYHDLKKVAPYLYEITFDDYRYDKNSEIKTNIDTFGCSSVRNGNYYGRNFDFIYNDVPEFVVHMKATKDRHASIGIAHLFNIHEEKINIKKYSKDLELLPNVTLDGINDQGVICSDNVVPKTDTKEVTGTNPTGKDLKQLFVVRYILDNANSADHAIELIKGLNISDSIGEHYNLHYMIADKNKTYIVEMIDNKFVIEDKKGNEQIMTNYYNNLPSLTENASGVERYNILKENYNEGNTFKGMWKLLKRVEFSKAYLFNKDTEWLSDFLPQSQHNNYKNNQEIINKFQDIKENYWITRAYNNRDHNDISFWFTVHNSTYDISKRKLRVTVQEDYNNYYDFKLDK